MKDFDLKEAVFSGEEGKAAFKELFYEGVKEGVRLAVWEIATNITNMPSIDFYEAIRKGWENASNNK